jgi:hypothetical protein
MSNQRTGLVLGGGDDGFVYLWDAKNKKEVKE